MLFQPGRHESPATGAPASTGAPVCAGSLAGTMSKRTHLERDLQIQVASFLAMMELRGHLTYFHPPNGGARSAREGANFKRMGVRAGVPDLCIMWQDCPPHHDDSYEIPDYGFIELKAPNGKLSKAQNEYHKILCQHGAKVTTCSSLAEVEEILASWSVPGLPYRS